MNALRTAPWLRAPLLLLRRPMVFLAIMAATAILSIAAASGPLFLSTVGTAGLHSQAEQTCPEKSEPGVVGAVPRREVETAVRRYSTATTSRGLATPSAVAIGETQVRNSFVHVFAAGAGTGALDHVRTLTPRTRASGAWLPDTLASRLGLRPGGTLTTAGGPVRVAGVYRDLAPDPFELANLPRFFCTWSDAIVPKVASDTAPIASSLALTPGPLLIADRMTVARLTGTPRLYLHSPMSTTANPLGRFDAAVRTVRDVLASTSPEMHVDDGLPGLVHRARAARDGISGSVLPIEIAGVVIAGLLVGGAGVFWANARRREVRLLVARGIGPVPLGGKAVLETLPAALLGALAGWGVTTVLVRAVGPASVFESGAALRALGDVAAVVAPGLLLIGVIGGTAARERTARSRSWLRRVPWEVVLILAAAAVALGRWNDSAVTVRNAVVDISPLVVLYPLLGVTGVLLLLGRVVAALLPAAGRHSGRGPTAWYLALRRMSRSRAIAVGLLVGTALPCCLLMYAATVRSSVEDEVTTKYQANLGAPHVLQVYGVKGALFDTRGTGTQVVRYEQDSTLGGESVTVMGVDPSTFGRFAFLDDEQRAAVGRLRTPAPGTPAPAIVANADRPSTSAITIADSRLRIDTVARPQVFPGLRDGSSPLVIVDQRALRGVDDTATERTNQLWTNDAHYGAARRLIADLRYSVLFELTSRVVVDSTGLLPVTWVFGYLQSLAVLIGVVAIAGLVFGLAARTRSRRVSYVLSRRMGMSRAAHVASLLVELSLVLGLGWVAGSALGIGSFGFVLGKLDVYPRLPPPPEFVVPLVQVLASAGIVVAVVLLATLATQLLAQRTRPAEILRLE